MKNLSNRLLLSFFAAIFCLTSMSLMAQDTPQPLAEAWVVTPKPHQAGEFHAALKEHVAVRQQHGDPWDWEIYTSYVGDTLNQYAIRYCCTNWADVDVYEKWVVENPAVMEHWRTKVDPHVEKIQHYFNVIDWANSHWGSEQSGYRFVAVDEFSIKSGYEAKLKAAMKKMSQIAINQGWVDAGNHWIWFHTVGGQSKISIATPHKNMASLGGSGESFGDFLGRHMRSEEAAADLMQEFAGSTEGRETTIWQRHSEFSTRSDR